MAPLRTCAPSVKLDVGRKQGCGMERGVPRRDYGGVAGAVNSHTPHLKTAQHRPCSPTAAAWQAPHGRSFPKQLAGAAWRDGRERKERSRGLDLLFPVERSCQGRRTLHRGRNLQDGHKDGLQPLQCWEAGPCNVQAGPRLVSKAPGPLPENCSAQLQALLRHPLRETQDWLPCNTV